MPTLSETAQTYLAEREHADRRMSSHPLLKQMLANAREMVVGKVEAVESKQPEYRQHCDYTHPPAIECDPMHMTPMMRLEKLANTAGKSIHWEYTGDNNVVKLMKPFGGIGAGLVSVETLVAAFEPILPFDDWSKLMTCGMRSAIIPGHFSSGFGQDAVEFRQMSDYADQTKYWWRYPEHTIARDDADFAVYTRLPLSELEKREIAAIQNHGHTITVEQVAWIRRERASGSVDAATECQEASGGLDRSAPEQFVVGVDPARGEQVQPITAEMFRLAVGRDPEQDDLDRCNCPQAGEIAHTGCGWDHEAGLPRFISATMPSFAHRALRALEPVTPDEIPVTEEMLAAGVAACGAGMRERSFVNVGDAEAAIYRAMRAIEPAELVPAGELAALKERDQLRRERDELAMKLAASEQRTRTVLEHYHKVCAARYARVDGIVSQETLGDTTYTVFATDPTTIVADPKHTASDVKPPAAPKAFPAGALRPAPKDMRRIGS